MQLIHMNGRMYDYNNGRFLSVDPFIQAPTSTQSLNPYTYIFNNPLSGTDPTGYRVATGSVCVDGLGCIGGGAHDTDRVPIYSIQVSNNGRGNSIGFSENNNSESSDISSKGNQEGILKGVVIPAFKNLGGDLFDTGELIFDNTVVPASQLVNKHIAIPILSAAGAVGDIIDDHQGELNTFQSLGPFGLEAEAGIMLVGKFLQLGTKGANSLKAGLNVAKTVENTVNVASSSVGSISAMRQVRLIQHGEKVSNIIAEGKELTWLTWNEHALVTLANGDRALVSGGPAGISFQEGQVSRIFGHTHPTNAPPSAADAQVLTELGQSKQFVFHGGQVSVVRPKN
jgi:hypothetical protein